MGTALSLLSYGENVWERCCIVTKLPNTVPLGQHILLKMHFAVQKGVFLTLKYGKTRTPLGELTTIPQTTYTT